MFRAPLCPSSGAQGRIRITAYGFEHFIWWLESRDAGRQVVCTV